MPDLDRVFKLLDRRRGRIQYGLDVVAWLAAIYAAAWVRFEFDLDRWDHGNLWLAFAIAAVAQLVVGWSLGMYHRRWRFGSFEEVSAVVGTAALVTTVVAVVNVTAFDPRLLPASVAVASGFAAVMAMSVVRYAWRLLIGRRMRPDADRSERVLVFGAGETGDMLVTSMLRNPEGRMLPVALLDDDPGKHRLKLRRVPVAGDRHALADAAKKYDASTVVVAAPSGGAELVRDISELAIDAGLDVCVLPSIDEILGSGGTVGVGDIRPITVQDLLGREPVQTDVEQIAGYIKGRRVLVTGAGGSIGSELSVQLASHDPAQLVLLDRDEGGLHAVQLRLEGKALWDSRNLVVADIRDLERMHEVFEEHRPEVVFHAAALKHLSLLEMYPDEALKTNVQGTHNMLEVSAAHGVDRFVNVSTDKAAAPISVLGYSKRIAERLTADMAAKAEGTYLSVRFGNVLGSRGSMLETFQKQIEDGGPVTVVDPEVTRYFMTVQEAVQLVIQAGAIGRDGEALVLDMGEPVSIEHVAKQLISRADRPIDITYTGLRPGEKMDEVLFGPDEIGVSTDHPLISHVAVPALSPADVAPPRTLGNDHEALADWMAALSDGIPIRGAAAG